MSCFFHIGAGRSAALATAVLVACWTQVSAQSSETTMTTSDHINKRHARHSRSDEELAKVLAPLQYEVMRRNGTEHPFDNEYWDNKREGIYVDPITGEPLFSSKDKYESGTGWPSFTAPINAEVVTSKRDTLWGLSRTEVRSSSSDSHLGHVFDDGPAPTGKRYCMNSAALRFVPVERMLAEGYGDLLPRFAGRSKSDEPANLADNTELATFAGGCFWGVEETFRQIPGVIRTIVGYAGGSTANPTYEKVCTDSTGHAEAVQVEFDPQKVSYEDLLKVFWQMHDPTQRNRQGPDIGSQYRSAIFAHSPAQAQAAERSRQELERSGRIAKPIATEITPAKQFYKAEEYHQHYLQKHDQKACHSS